MRRQQAGFTFLEMMIVVVILGVMAALVLPNLSGPREKTALAASGRQIASLGLLARQYAIAHRTEVKLLFNQATSEYRLELPPPTDERLARSLREGEVGSSEEVPRRLEEMVRYVEFKRDGEELREEVIELVFYPNGSCNGLAVHLANKKGKSLTVEFETATARPEAYSSAPKSFAEKLREKGLNPEDYGIADDGTAVATARRPGEGFSQSSGMNEDERVAYYTDVASRIMRRTQAQYQATKEGGQAAVYGGDGR